MEELDQARAVRSGEELDISALERYLQEHFGNSRYSLNVSQFPSGASNLTYLIERGNEQWVLRRPPLGEHAGPAHDMMREARVLRAVKEHFPLVPEVLLSCDDKTVLGFTFFIMQRIQGFIPRRDFPAALNPDAAMVRSMCLHGLECLVAIHQMPIDNPELQALGRGEGYVARQIQGWAARFARAATPNAAAFTGVLAWLQNNMPADSGLCLIHNDFRFDNLVFSHAEPTEVVGVLDWEMATFGDPLMDLGNSLAYWVQADDDAASLQSRLQPTHTEGMLRREEVVEYYLSRTGRSIESFLFYEIYGLFRLAVIVQQIYHRYFHGLTRDPRFAGFADFVALLERRCMHALAERG